MVLIDKFPVGLNFEDESDKVQLTNPVDLGESWTVETWLSLSNSARQNLEQNLSEQKLIASDPQQDARFGNSVAVSGNNAIVGAYQEDSKTGAAYIFEFDSSGTWQKKQKLIASDPEVGDLFGRSVAISGNLAIVGADDEDTGGRSAGAAYIFERDDSGTWTEKAKIQASNKGASDNFGYAVAISNNFAIVGAYGEDTGGSNAGSAYIFEGDDSGTWTEKAKIQASDAQVKGYFGNSVAIDANFAIVGAWQQDTVASDAGAAYIFERDSAGSWTEKQKLIASDGQEKDYFGRSVAISNNIALVGADNQSTGGKSAGAAYLFEPDDSGNWIEKQKLQASDKQEWVNFGYSVGINGNSLIVGAYGEDTREKNAGAAYLFERDRSGSWIETQKLQASEAQRESKFGNSVAISDGFAIVGAYLEDIEGNNAGTAYIFALSDTDISVPEPVNRFFQETQKLVASDSGQYDFFGSAVAIDNNFAIVGAKGEDTGGRDAGAIYFFELDNNGSWTEKQKLIASEPKSGDLFGRPVAISDNIAVAGTNRSPRMGFGQGSAYIFERDDSGTWAEQKQLLKSEPQPGDYFGTSVAVSNNIVIIGASGNPRSNSPGSAYIFERDNSGAWTEKQQLIASNAEGRDSFGNSVAIINNIAIVGAFQEKMGGSNAGAAYIFERDNSGTWTETQKLIASDMKAGDCFGYSVAISDDTAIVGAFQEKTGGSNAGAAYIFERDNSGTWTETQKLIASDTQAGDLFGRSVAINLNLAIVGAFLEDTGGSNAGATYIFERDSAGTWTEKQKLQASDTDAGDYFGNSVAISDNFVIVGSACEDAGQKDTGAAYIFAMSPESNSQPVRNRNILVGNSNSDSPVVIQDQSKLGTVVDGVFYDSGYNLGQLTPGWHHMTAVAQNTTTKFYIDGQKIADVQQALSGQISTIGNSTSGSGELGKLAEVRLWNRSLSESEIAANSSKVRLTGTESGLAAYYPLNEATGNEVADRTSNNNNGTVAGTNWWCGTLPVGNLNHQAMQFDGIDDYIDLGDGVVVGDHFTQEAWIYSTITDNGYHGFLGQQAPKRAPSIWLCQQNRLHADFNQPGRLKIHTPPVLFANTWNHVAVTYDGEVYKVYVNGEECFSKILSNEPASTTPIKYIGKVDNHFKGQIAEVRIWNKTRTREEIQADMYQRLTGNESDLVAYLPLNQIQAEGGTQKVLDLTNNNNHGTIHGATLETSNTLPILGTVNETISTNDELTHKAIQFNGTGNYIEVPYSTTINPEQFTVSCWAKVTGRAGSYRSPITSRSNYKGYIFYAGSNNKWQMWVGNGSSWTTVTGANVVLNTWTNLTATYDGSKLKFYLNGEFAAELTTSLTINTACPLRIGAGRTESTPNYLFPGEIAEVRIWKTARTESEIKANINQRLTGNESDLVAYFPLDEIQVEGDTQKILDRTSNNNHGIVHGATLESSNTLPIS